MAINDGVVNGNAINAPVGAVSPPTPVESTSFEFGYLRNQTTPNLSANIHRYSHGVSLTFPYEIPTRLPVDVGSGEGFVLQNGLVVDTGFTISLGDLVTGAQTISVPLGVVVNTPFEVIYSYVNDVVNTPFEILQPVALNSAFEITYNMTQRVTGPHEIPAPLVTTANSAFDIVYSILNFNPVVGPFGGTGQPPGFKIIYNLEDNTTLDVTNAIIMTHEGEQIGLQQGSVEIDEGGFNWRGRILLADVTDYGRFQFNEDVQLDIYGETYNMIVQSKSLDRNSPAGASAQLELLGVAARFDVPIASPINQTFGVIGANAAVDQILGTTVQWDIVDWVIPANRLAGDNASPVELASKIVEAAGGRLEANPDGTIRVRHLYPVSLVDYSTATPAHVYTENDSILAVAEGIRNQEIVNRIRIRDTSDSAFRDRIVFEADDDSGLRGDLFVYPSPYRSIVLEHTGPTNIILNPQVPFDILQVKTEIIEIREGTGSVQFGIAQITNIDWMEVNLGGLSFEPDSTTVTATSIGTTPLTTHSLVEVTYTTRAKHWRTESLTPIQVQYLVIDENA